MSSKSPEPSGKLSSSVKPRHVTMISLGGTIGAGLFIGIAEPLTQAGPLGTILAYFAAGLVMLGTMMCLGELATSFPHSGSFQYYAYKFFPSPLISYTIGWMYWLSWVFALAAGLVAAGIVSHEMWPNIPIWLYCGGYLAILTLVNMLSAGAFGEFEYWLAGIKVFAIVLSPAVFGSLVIKPQQPNGCRHCGWRGNSSHSALPRFFSVWPSWCTHFRGRN